MVSPRLSPLLVLALVSVCVMLRSAEGGCHSSYQIECKTGGACISRNSICNKQLDCHDGSDEDPEMCKLWPPNDRNCRYDSSRPFYYGGSCYSAQDMCQSSTKPSSLDHRICEIVLNKAKLEPQQGMNMSIEVVSLLSSAVNSTLAYKAPDCPMLYTRIANECISFFSPAKVPWAEARQFCRSIYGDLWHSKNPVSYVLLLDYMREEQFTSNYWIGGRFDIDTNAWSWVTDDAAMPLGAPYWALKPQDSCVPRGPPHTDPFSTPPAALPGARCYRTVLTPKERASGWCSAMTYEHFYYWTDEMCKEEYSPLCVFTGLAAPQKPDTH